MRDPVPPTDPVTLTDVFLTFLRLGMTSFGGPLAHIGYFRREFVERRGWIDDDAFAQIVAFCSILPGPTSSQVGMIVGTVRGGWRGTVLAWLGFTLPSALAMGAFGFALRAIEAAGSEPRWYTGLLAGLTAAASAVVAQAVLALARSQCPDRETQTVAFGATILALVLQAVPGLQWIPILVGALVGALFLRRSAQVATSTLPLAIAAPVAIACAIGFMLIVATAAAIANAGDAGVLCATLVRAGTLVFGGGHIILPLLQSLVGDGLFAAHDFYAGYGAAQALPGPLNTFATFLGVANLSPLHGLAGGIVATLLIFAPSFLLVFALAPVWNRLRTDRLAIGALRGAGAAVVGLLGAVLYSPLIVTLAGDLTRIAIALGAFALIVVWKAPPWAVVASAAAIGALSGLAGAPL
jgi:chromate transporter